MVPAQPADSRSMPLMRCTAQSQNMSMTLTGEPLPAFSSQPGILACMHPPAPCQGRPAAAQVIPTSMAMAMARGMQAIAYTCRETGLPMLASCHVQLAGHGHSHGVACLSGGLQKRRQAGAPGGCTGRWRPDSGAVLSGWSGHHDLLRLL